MRDGVKMSLAQQCHLLPCFRIKNLQHTSTSVPGEMMLADMNSGMPWLQHNCRS